MNKFLLILLVATSLRAAEMQCTILGCTDGEVRVSTSSTGWTFRIYEMFYLTNPLLDEMGDFLRATGRIGEEDRLDRLSFEILKDHCVEERELGNFVCRGNARYASARVTGDHTTIAPLVDLPWIFEIRKSVGAEGIEWSMSVSDGVVKLQFQTVSLYHCRL